MAIPMPPLNLNVNSASSAPQNVDQAFNNSGWTVNMGSAGAGATGVPSWALVAAGLLVVVLLIRRKKG